MRLLKSDWEEPAEDEVAAEGNPYSVVRRSGRWFVVKRDSGTVVPGGDHGRDKKKALAHFRALEMATSGEGE
jgi:hypothetical protein